MHIRYACGFVNITNNSYHFSAIYTQPNILCLLLLTFKANMNTATANGTAIMVDPVWIQLNLLNYCLVASQSI